MFEKFKEGLVFGGGFGISFIIIWYVFAYLFFPMLVSTQFEKSAPKELSQIESEVPASALRTDKYEIPGKRFHELNLDDQIKQASVIAIAKYEKAADGKMKAIIKEVLKKEPGTVFYYDVGDEFTGSSYYPKEDTMYGESVVIFFTGSPASMKMSMSYSGDRIHSLGDIPVELFRKKCESSS